MAFSINSTGNGFSVSFTNVTRKHPRKTNTTPQIKITGAGVSVKQPRKKGK